MGRHVRSWFLSRTGIARAMWRAFAWRTVSMSKVYFDYGIRLKHKNRLWLFGILFVLLFESMGHCSQMKGHKKNLESFFCSVDQDGDGEIEQHEATEFLALMGGDFDSSKDLKDSNSGTKDGSSDLLFKVNFGFSYGGSTICAEEMQDHLQNMLTADHVVDWITHGLQLPQYAEVFRRNAINGLDFPALIENESQTLTEELGVHSALHRIKITHALVRQVFGLGVIPGPPQEPVCETAGCNGILLNWKSPLSRGYPPIHKYLVQRWDDGASMWLSRVDDTKETSFLDKNGLFPGRKYSYRVRAWGGHGPSEWVILSSCHTSHRAMPPEICQFESISGSMGLNKMHATEDMTHSINAASTKSSRLDSVGDNGKDRSRLKALWGWICSVNGALLILGVLSRNSYLFRITIATWVIFIKILRIVKSKLLQAQSSQYFLVRILAGGFLAAFAFWNYVHAKLLLLSTCTSKPPSPDSFEMKSYSYSFHNDVGFSAADCSFEEMMAAISEKEISNDSIHFVTNIDKKKQGNSSFDRLPKGTECQETFNVDEMTASDCSTGVTSPMGVELSRTITVNKPEKAINKQVLSTGNNFDRSRMAFSRSGDGSIGQLDTLILSTPAFVEQGNCTCNDSETSCEVHTAENSKYSNLQSYAGSAPVKSRNVCNSKDCKVRFDRLLSFSSWRMKLSKHYCRECQLVYCVKHTQISPHGPFGQCGLDSSCVCCNCFKDLSTEVQQKLEQVNKLRVGPSAGSLSMPFFRTGPKRKNMVQEGDSFTLSSHGVQSDILSADNHPDSLLDRSFVHFQEVNEHNKRKYFHEKTMEGAFPFNLYSADEGASSHGSSSNCS